MVAQISKWGVVVVILRGTANNTVILKNVISSTTYSH